MQREAVEALIQELPKFRLKAVPTDCSECPICLEEFHVGNEVDFLLHVLNFLTLPVLILNFYDAILFNGHSVYGLSLLAYIHLVLVCELVTRQMNATVLLSWTLCRFVACRALTISTSNVSTSGFV